jgi:hypothetical protein
MGWLTDLTGTTVGLDTAPFIYYFERHSSYLPLVEPFFEALDRGEILGITSTVTLTEILVHPYRNGNSLLAQQYARILTKARHCRRCPFPATLQ